MAHDAQHRHVRITVGVREAVVQIMTVLTSGLSDEAGGVRARNDRSKPWAGCEAVLDLEPIRDRMRRAEVVREALHQEVEGSRNEHDVVSLVTAARHEVACGGVNRLAEDTVEG